MYMLLQVRQLKMMIATAGPLEKIERLNMMLRNGQMPGMEENGGETEERVNQYFKYSRVKELTLFQIQYYE